jgi:hypothetical protein
MWSLLAPPQVAPPEKPINSVACGSRARLHWLRKYPGSDVQEHSEDPRCPASRAKVGPAHHRRRGRSGQTSRTPCGNDQEGGEARRHLRADQTVCSGWARYQALSDRRAPHFSRVNTDKFGVWSPFLLFLSGDLKMCASKPAFCRTILGGSGHFGCAVIGSALQGRSHSMFGNRLAALSSLRSRIVVSPAATV